jgi:GT2 family glycosyltransferase
MEEMLGLLLQKDVAVAGAKLLYSEGSIQHAGDLVGVGGVANHAHAFLHRDNPGYQGRAKLAQDLSAVTGACLMVWKSVYETLGGLNENDLPVAFNDVDFCLRVREAGKRVVWTPWAELYHHESQSRCTDDTPEQISRMMQEINYMLRRWGYRFGHDPAYNPNLSHERPDFSLSHAPVTPRPW